MDIQMTLEDTKGWPPDWREKGEKAKALILAHPELGMNSPEYHDYMDYCGKVCLFNELTARARTAEGERGQS